MLRPVPPLRCPAQTSLIKHVTAFLGRAVLLPVARDSSQGGCGEGCQRTPLCAVPLLQKSNLKPWFCPLCPTRPRVPTGQVCGTANLNLTVQCSKCMLSTWPLTAAMPCQAHHSPPFEV